MSLHLGNCPHLCIHNVLAIVLFNLVKVFVDLGNYQEILGWAFCLICKSRLFSSMSRTIYPCRLDEGFGSNFSEGYLERNGRHNYWYVVISDEDISLTVNSTSTMYHMWTFLYLFIHTISVYLLYVLFFWFLKFFHLIFIWII